MASIEIRYFAKRPRGNRNGGGFRYFWQPSKSLIAEGWKMMRLSDDEVEAMRQAEQKNRELDDWRAGRITSPTTESMGTVDALISLYLNSRDFAEKKPSTKRSYLQALKIIREWAGDQPARAITPNAVRELYEALAHKRAVGNKVIRTLRLLMEFARRHDLVKDNPATRPGIKDRSSKGKLWPHESVALFTTTADAMGDHAIGSAILLNEWMGQRPGDVLSLKRAQYHSGGIWIKQAKTGADVMVPIDIVPHLRERLEAELARAEAIAPLADEIFIDPRTKHGWNDSTFRHRFAAIRSKACAKLNETDTVAFMELTMQSLRHTAVTRMGEAGLPPALIASISGHSQQQCVAILNRYNVTTTRMAKEAFLRRFTFEQNEEKSNVRVHSESNEKRKAGEA